MQMGIVSARHVDHVGLVVPDLDAAIDFFEQALGALLLWRVGPFEETPTGVPIESVTLAMLRLGPSLNVELQAFVADTQRQESPSNIDIGAGHIAFFVNDIQAAAQSLRDNGAELLRGPIKAKGDIKKGEEIWYFKTPWGGFMEILWRPDGLPYENQTPFRLYQPNDSWADED
jgi:catechol 2,3-dioxygenase-like lactoylglutathione lyase family enzyme